MKTVEQQESPEPATVRERIGVPLALDPTAEELLSSCDQFEGEKRILFTCIIGGYLREDFDLDLNNETHQEVRDMLEARGMLREPKISALPIKPPSSEAFEA